MKKILTLMLFTCILFSCHAQINTKDYLPVNVYSNEEIINEQNYFYKKAQQSKSIDTYIKRVLIENKRIKEIIFNRKTGVLTYYVNIDSEEPENDFLYLAKIDEFDWTYYLYHDIYKASFFFKSVKKVSVF